MIKIMTLSVHWFVSIVNYDASLGQYIVLLESRNTPSGHVAVATKSKTEFPFKEGQTVYGTVKMECIDEPVKNEHGASLFLCNANEKDVKVK